jgi:hypothetical protein
MPVLIFLKDLLLSTLAQLVALFGGVALFGIAIHAVSQLTFGSVERSFGSKGAYFLAGLGTPVHELGHALFCVIFFHRIDKIEFFKPDPVTGTLGYVAHRWTKSNVWQVLGNFFIGIGPLILGCAILFGLFYLLIPGAPPAWNSIREASGEAGADYFSAASLNLLGNSVLSILSVIFTADNLAGWRFWVFFYLSLCVASNMRLSVADMKGSLLGLGYVTLPFFVVNFVALLTGFNAGKYLSFAVPAIYGTYALLTIALLMALMAFVLAYAVSTVHYKATTGRFLRPF